MNRAASAAIAVALAMAAGTAHARDARVPQQFQHQHPCLA
jgi:hypothetical protein